MLEPIWYESAVRDLEALPHWREAEQVAAAVRLYAEQGIGSCAGGLCDGMDGVMRRGVLRLNDADPLQISRVLR